MPEKNSMKQVILSPKSLSVISEYIANYERYFFDLYSNTGIWWESLILDNYNTEAKDRHNEILQLLNRRLCSEDILGRTLVNSLLLPWRSKVIFVTWEDIGEVRRIIDLEIR